MIISIKVLVFVILMLLPITLTLLRKGVNELSYGDTSVLSYIYIGSFFVVVILSLHFSFIGKHKELENKEIVETSEYVIQDVKKDSITINGMLLSKNEYTKEEYTKEITKDNKVEELVYKGYRQWLCFKVEDIEYEYIVK